MSNPITKLIKQKFKKNKKNDNNQNKNNDAKPGFFSFIKTIQNLEETSKADKLNNNKGKNNDNIKHENEQKDYLEENDKEIKLGAQKGLLLLLNGLSKNKFFPEINDFFDKMKDFKLEELRMKSKEKNQRNNINNIKREENMDIKNSLSQNNNINTFTPIQTNENKNIKNNENKISKSVTKVKKITKTKKKTNKIVKFSSKSMSKNIIKDNSNLILNQNIEPEKIQIIFSFINIYFIDKQNNNIIK